MKKQAKKLTLAKETLRTLEEGVMMEVRGASGQAGCPKPTETKPTKTKPIYTSVDTE